VKKNIGIILKRYQPKKRTISILDRELGKIRCVPRNQNIVLGSLVAYTITSNQSPKRLTSSGLTNNRLPYFIQEVEILHIPFETAIDDILFFHHVLELCYSFIPPQCPAAEIFEIIKYLYFFPNMIKYNIDKKLYLFKLFTLLGLHPEGVQFQTPSFHNLATKSIDSIVSEHLHLKSEIEIDSWLRCCIATQPKFSNFKTINFLYKK